MNYQISKTADPIGIRRKLHLAMLEVIAWFVYSV